MRRRRTHGGLSLVGTPPAAAALTALMAEATVLGSSYTRSGNQWNPDTGAFVGANVQVQRNVVVGGVTVPMTLIERAGTNLATTASATTTGTATSAGQKTIWWDGGAADYTVTTNGSGVVSTKKTTADGRNYVTITSVANGEVITCTRAGGATNTHLQIEEVDNPTSKIALSGSRSQCDKRGTIAATGDNGTILMLFQPYGWTQNIGPNDAGVQYFRQTSASHMYFAKSTATKPTFVRDYNGGSASKAQQWMPKDGYNSLISFSWSLADVCDVRPSGRGWEEFTDAGSASKAVAQPGVTPITSITSLDIGGWASAAANRQCNGWIALLAFTRVLTQAEVDSLAIAFEGVNGYNPELSAWGDSETAYDSGINKYPERLVTTFRPGWRLMNGGVGGETSAQILTRFLADSRKWRGFNIFWSNNSPALSDIQAMVAMLGHSRYLVLSQFNDATTQQSGTSGYNTVIAYNHSLAAAFGANYFDARAYLITLNNGGGDAADTAHDCVGTSQRGDSLHLNSTGQLNLATKLDLVMTAMGVAYP